MTWTTIELKEKARLLAYLETQRSYAAYAIGDLEESLFVQCEWYGAYQDGQIQALALLFHGLQPPALFLMGEVDGLRSLLQAEVCAPRVYFMCRPEHLDVTFKFYAWQKAVAMWRMAFKPGRNPLKHAKCERLGAAYQRTLQELYILGGGDAFTEAQLAQGVFYGISASGKLVAAAGTHLVSRTYGVAAVGNVFTHPDYRRRGYGEAVTGAVVAELKRRGIGDIVLNVAQENRTAIGLYERLGFERVCAFFEGLGSRL
jgi:ribosomal protein S18 acetylase RimI-like enzyme